MIDLQSLPKIITAIGGLGTAAFGIVDASKVLGNIGVNSIGFSAIRTTVTALTPGKPTNALSQAGLDVGSKSNGMSSTFVSSIPRMGYSCENMYVRNGAGTAFSPRTTPSKLRSVW